MEVIFADLPQVPPGAMGRFFLTQMVAVAELEAGLVSERTKAALAAAKRKGTRLGNPNLAKASASGVASIRRNADTFAKQVLPVIRDVQQGGARSLRAIAQALEARGVPTARGGQWTPVQVNACSAAARNCCALTMAEGGRKASARRGLARRMRTALRPMCCRSLSRYRRAARRYCAR